MPSFQALQSIWSIWPWSETRGPTSESRTPSTAEGELADEVGPRESARSGGRLGLSAPRAAPPDRLNQLMDFMGEPVRVPALLPGGGNRLRELTTEPLDALKTRVVFRSLPDAAHECWCARPDAAHPRDGWREQEARQAVRATGAEAPVAEFTSRRSSAGTESRSGNAEAV